MKNNFPITIVEQLNEITVFQTAALQTADLEHNDSQTQAQNIKSMLHQGQTSYGELNLGLHVKDDAMQVLDNRMRLLSTINTQLINLKKEPIESLYWVNQVHGQQIHDVDSMTLNMCPMNADAMTSQQAGLGLAIMTADCIPIVLYQPATGKIAAIHAGWQGLACGVIKATTERFVEKGEILAWMGACISQPNYEVGYRVRDQLLAGCKDNQLLTEVDINNFEQLFCMETAANNQDNTNKLKLNLPKVAVAQLESLHITIANDLPVPCNYADARYYSYRRQTHLQQSATGRMALIIVRSPTQKNSSA